MREFPNDPYQSMTEASVALPRDRGLSEMAHFQINNLCTLAKNEGLTVYFNRGCLSEWRTGYRYDPDEPSVEVALEQSWPNFRWCFAVAVGKHFTRGSFVSEVTNELHCEERWRAKAEAWASNFLASSAARLIDRSFPDNSKTEESIRRYGGSFTVTTPNPDTDDSPDQKHHDRRCNGTHNGERCPWLKQRGTDYCRNHRLDLCKGIKSNGKPCRGYRVQGTAFCQHHQETELPTLAQIVESIGGGHRE